MALGDPDKALGLVMTAHPSGNGVDRVKALHSADEPLKCQGSWNTSTGASAPPSPVPPVLLQQFGLTELFPSPTLAPAVPHPSLTFPSPLKAQVLSPGCRMDTQAQD